MKKDFPVTPFPLLGEIVHECAVRSGLVSSNAEQDSKLYADLKALKDDRKRPALRPAMLPLDILVELENRLAKYTGSEMYACVTFVQIRRALEQYALTIGNADVTLLTREQVVEQILWPTLFSAAAAACLEPLDIIFHVTDLKSLLEDEAPFARFLRGLCVRGADDNRLIWEFRAERHGIDPENCEQTVREWLNGSNVPTLDSCSDILEALGMSHDAGTRQWVLVARLLAKTSLEHRAHILNRVLYESKAPVTEQFHEIRTVVGWRAGEKLNIGRDRPFSKIKDALYRLDVPRDPLLIEEMLERQRVTWLPIANQTRHTLEWLWGRFLVLNARYVEAFERYQSAYEWGFGRDRDVVTYVLNEMAALAGKLGNWRAAQKYLDIAAMYGEPEWDGDRESISDFFDRQFPPQLFFFVGPQKPAPGS
jgi:hypothetical protein